MKLKEALRRAAAALAVRAADDAHLEAEVIMMHLLGVERAGLYLRLEDELSLADEAELERLLARRLSGEPVAYIIGRREFFGRDFYVAHGALIPRPESELLVEEALAFSERCFPGGDPVIADIGTGSGAIAISLALTLPRARVYAVDISPRALEIAAVNCRRYDIHIQLLEGDLLAPLPQAVDIIVANLPYIRDDELPALSAEIRLHEPAIALGGGGDGMDELRRLLEGAADKLRPGGAILLEIGAGQGPALASLAEGLFPEASVGLVADLGGADRVLRVVGIRSEAVFHTCERC